jgi:hypothetical protein
MPKKLRKPLKGCIISVDILLMFTYWQKIYDLFTVGRVKWHEIKATKPKEVYRGIF